MTEHPSPDRDPPIALSALLLVVGAAALVAGLYGRFKGIGTWPLGVDEFYISRSIDNVMQTGVPRFPCGGYYTRGLTFQYSVAALRMLGLPPEFAGRLVAGMSSLAVLPAAFLLGKRIKGSLAGWLAVIILCVSIWEIEMARFARMYAPFQAMFTWYLVFYLRYTVDRKIAALKWMIALSALGVLTWEGGVLLGLANIFAALLVHERGRLKAADWRRLAGLLVLLLAFFAVTRDLRGFAEAPASGAAGSDSLGSQSSFVSEWFSELLRRPGWAFGYLLPLSLAVSSLQWIWSHRQRWMVACGLGFALLAAALHQFTVTGGILAIMLLSKLIDPREFAATRARHFVLALAAFLLFWLAFESSHLEAADVRSAAATAASLITQRLFGYPDIYDEVIRPWARTLPFLSLGLVLAIGSLTWRTVASRTERADAIASLLSLTTLIVLAVGTTSTDRIETRYTFFLYPLLIVLAVAAVLMPALRLRMARNLAIVLSAAVPLLCFSGSEDFQPKHIAAVDSAEINFRVGMSAVRAAHYYPRNDMRVVGEWLSAHVQPGDVVVTGIPNLEQYYSNFDYFFLDEDDARYATYVCRDAHQERWTDHPLLYTTSALKPIVASGHRIFAILYTDVEKRMQMRTQIEGWSVTPVWTAVYDRTHVVLIAAKPAQSSRPAQPVY